MGVHQRAFGRYAQQALEVFIGLRGQVALFLRQRPPQQAVGMLGVQLQAFFGAANSGRVAARQIKKLRAKGVVARSARVQAQSLQHGGIGCAQPALNATRLRQRKMGFGRIGRGFDGGDGRVGRFLQSLLLLQGFDQGQQGWAVGGVGGQPLAGRRFGHYRPM